MKFYAICFLVFSFLTNFAMAAAGDPRDLTSRYGHNHATYVLNEDGTSIESREWSKTVLKEAALAGAKHASISFSTSVQKAEIIEAYTKKADGTRIDVPKNNYQLEVNSGKEKDAPVFSDRTTLSVVFPDVAVGDTVAFSYRIVQTEPLFPGHFSIGEIFSRQVANNDVKVRIEYPAALWVQYNAREMKEVENSERAGRKILEWRYTNPQPVQTDRRDYSVFDPDKEVGVSFSTFKNYAEISTAYGVRAVPKAAVTERVQALADEITKGKESKKEQARALYEWTAKNITYGGNCIGVGAVVPHDISFILDNKMGDCKDHATLLQALLAARGIQSTQALVNAGSVFRLPKTPLVSTVNHVINYIPSFDLFVDSTSATTPFGMLPDQDIDKPVLLVEGFKDGMKTPVPPLDSRQQKVKSVLKILPDGSMTGTVEVFIKGQQAAYMRAGMRRIKKEDEEDFVKNVYRSWGMKGSGKFEKDDPTELIDTYHYKATVNVEKFIKLPGTGAFYIYPPFENPDPIKDFVESAMEPEKDVEVACSSGASTEEYIIELPKTMKVLSVPDNLKLANDFLSYSATYKLKGNVLTVKRVMEDRTKGNVCAPEVFVAYKKFAEPVVDNLKSQVLYK